MRIVYINFGSSLPSGSSSLSYSYIRTMNMLTLCRNVYGTSIEEGFKQKARQRSSHQCGGQNVLNSLPRSLFYRGWIGRNRWIQPFLSSRPRQNSYSAARNWIKSAPPNRCDDICLTFCINPPLRVGWNSSQKHLLNLMNCPYRRCTTVSTRL